MIDARNPTLRALPSSLIFSKDISSFCGFGLRYIAKLEKQGRFPKRLQLGARRIAWSAEEIAQWQKGTWKPAQEPTKD